MDGFRASRGDWRRHPALPRALTVGPPWAERQPEARRAGEPAGLGTPPLPEPEPDPGPIPQPFPDEPGPKPAAAVMAGA